MGGKKGTELQRSAAIILKRGEKKEIVTGPSFTSYSIGTEGEEGRRGGGE